MQYSFTCPGCGDVLSVEAYDDEEAVEELMAAGAEHAEEAHPEGMEMSEEEMREMVREQMVMEEE